MLGRSACPRPLAIFCLTVMKLCLCKQSLCSASLETSYFLTLLSSKMCIKLWSLIQVIATGFLHVLEEYLLIPLLYSKCNIHSKWVGCHWCVCDEARFWSARMLHIFLLNRWCNVHCSLRAASCMQFVCMAFETAFAYFNKEFVIDWITWKGFKSACNYVVPCAYKRPQS